MLASLELHQSGSFSSQEQVAAMREQPHLFRRSIGRWRKLVNENQREALRYRQPAPHSKCTESSAQRHTTCICPDTHVSKLRIQRRLGGEVLPLQLRHCLASQECTLAPLAFKTSDIRLSWVNDQEDDDCGIDLEVTAAFYGTAQPVSEVPPHRPLKRRRQRPGSVDSTRTYTCIDL
jgi:hypothetical protein